VVENFQFRACESFQQVEVPARHPSRAEILSKAKDFATFEIVSHLKK